VGRLFGLLLMSSMVNAFAEELKDISTLHSFYKEMKVNKIFNAGTADPRSVEDLKVCDQLNGYRDFALGQSKEVIEQVFVVPQLDFTITETTVPHVTIKYKDNTVGYLGMPIDSFHYMLQGWNYSYTYLIVDLKKSAVMEILKAHTSDSIRYKGYAKYEGSQSLILCEMPPPNQLDVINNHKYPKVKLIVSDFFPYMLNSRYEFYHLQKTKKYIW
jgi:hypothetical protein